MYQLVDFQKHFLPEKLIAFNWLSCYLGDKHVNYIRFNYHAIICECLIGNVRSDCCFIVGRLGRVGNHTDRPYYCVCNNCGN